MELGLRITLCVYTFTCEMIPGLSKQKVLKVSTPQVTAGVSGFLQEVPRILYGASSYLRQNQGVSLIFILIPQSIVTQQQLNSSLVESLNLCFKNLLTKPSRLKVTRMTRKHS